MTPASSSTPPVRIGLTMTPSMTTGWPDSAAASAAATDSAAAPAVLTRLKPARSAVMVRSPSATPPMSDLWVMPAELIRSATG